ncbi:MAG: NAD-dependent protein deacylase [Nitrososphaerota archaeon]|jgi:NAD-dependent deacetylase|nr:NAD-dependent protein deacylase [Nitrososphaerota archaeon]
MFADIIQNSKNTVFFGGAGVSTESNIPDFRSSSGLYMAQNVYGYSPEELLSHTFFIKKPELFFQYYKQNLIHVNAKPNAAHVALAKLEKARFISAVITQNIDGLHQAAGSINVIELHGSNSRQYCMKCGEKHDLQYILKPENCNSYVPKCKKCKDGIVRPDVVLYEEQLDPDVLQAATESIAAADCLIIGGTSLNVYPAAGLLRYFNGNKIILINKSETTYDNHADIVIHENIGTVLSTITGQLKL